MAATYLQEPIKKAKPAPSASASSASASAEAKEKAKEDKSAAAAAPAAAAPKPAEPKAEAKAEAKSDAADKSKDGKAEDKAAAKDDAGKDGKDAKEAKDKDKAAEPIAKSPSSPKAAPAPAPPPADTRSEGKQKEGKHAPAEDKESAAKGDGKTAAAATQLVYRFKFSQTVRSSFASQRRVLLAPRSLVSSTRQLPFFADVCVPGQRFAHLRFAVSVTAIRRRVLVQGARALRAEAHQHRGWRRGECGWRRGRLQRCRVRPVWSLVAVVRRSGQPHRLSRVALAFRLPRPCQSSMNFSEQHYIAFAQCRVDGRRGRR